MLNTPHSVVCHLAARSCWWLMLSMLSPATPRFLRTDLLSSCLSPSLCLSGTAPSQVQHLEFPLLNFTPLLALSSYYENNMLYILLFRRTVSKLVQLVTIQYHSAHSLCLALYKNQASILKIQKLCVYIWII